MDIYRFGSIEGKREILGDLIRSTMDVLSLLYSDSSIQAANGNVDLSSSVQVHYLWTKTSSASD